MTLDDVRAARAELADALSEAHLANRGVPAGMEDLVRTHARMSREAGMLIEDVIRDVKALIREHAGMDELIFTPKIVGWTVAGYFKGSNL